MKEEPQRRSSSATQTQILHESLDSFFSISTQAPSTVLSTKHYGFARFAEMDLR